MSEEAKPQRRVVAHTGKVARLPLAVREELNRRLFQGDAESDVLEWLNSDPVAVQSLAALFDGAPIMPSHLASWKRTGYVEWAERQTAKEQRLAPFKRALAETETAPLPALPVDAFCEAMRLRRLMHVERAEIRPDSFLFLVVDGLAAELLEPDFRLLALGLVVMRGGPPHSMAPFPLPKPLAALLGDATDDAVIVELARRQLHTDLSGFPRVVGPVPVPTWEEATAARWRIFPKGARIERAPEPRRRKGAYL